MFDKFLYKANFVLFIGILTVMGILFFVLPKEKTSEFEKRDLCKMPIFSWEKLRSGQFIDSIDLYIADNFPFRDRFVSFSFQLEQLRGIQSNDIAFYNEGIDMDAGTENLQEDSLNISEKSDSSLVSNANDTTHANDLYYNDGFASEVEKLSRGLLIYKGMAIQMFGGGRGTAIHMSKMANEVQKALGDAAQVYVGVTPTHGEFYLPSEYIAEAVSEKKNIDTIYKYLAPEVKSFDVTKELFEHKDEYIFFNTDHHWTGLGAYYAYVAWCKSAEVKPIPLEGFDKRVIPGFLGTLYRKTRDKRLEENGDSVVYYRVPICFRAYRLFGINYNQIKNSHLYVDIAKGGNAYGVFLGGDVPALCVVSKQENNRRALVVKNSFGNPFSTYFVSHFERTYIIDYRYFKGNLVDFVKKNKVTDVILFHNSFSANTPSHVDMTKQMLSDSSVIVPHALPDWNVMFPEGKMLSSFYEKQLKAKEKELKQQQPKNIQRQSQGQPLSKKQPIDSLNEIN